MDALSDVLAHLKIQSTISSRCESRGRWAFRFPGYEANIKFGSVMEGAMQLQLQGARKPIVFQAGDFYLLTNSQPFVSSSIPAGIPEDGPAAYRAARGSDGVVRIGSEGPPVILVSGRFTFEGEASRLLLRQLPELVRLRGDDPATRPLASLLELLRWEDDAARPGTGITQTSLASLLLVQALRIFLGGTRRPRGWLGAMVDKRVGAALSAMHADLAQRWTVETLAHVAGMSRTAFAVRFKELVGATPLEYLTDWRMTVARGLLKTGEGPVAEVAERVGYLSDTAFSAAFKRATGASPASFRNA